MHAHKDDFLPSAWCWLRCWVLPRLSHGLSTAHIQRKGSPCFPWTWQSKHPDQRIHSLSVSRCLGVEVGSWDAQPIADFGAQSWGKADPALPVSHKEGREGKWRMTKASKERSVVQKQAHLPAVHSQCRTHSALPPLQASNFPQWPGSTWVPIPSSLLPQPAQSLEVRGQSLLFFCSFSDVLFVERIVFFLAPRWRLTRLTRTN